MFLHVALPISIGTNLLPHGCVVSVMTAIVGHTEDLLERFLSRIRLAVVFSMLSGAKEHAVHVL